MTELITEDDHLNSESDIPLESVKARAVRGVAVLTGRTFLLQILSFVAWFFLSVFLDAAEIGVFVLVSAVVSFLRYFSDVGLAAALIQKKEKVEAKELNTTFLIQQVLVLLLLVVLFLFSPFLKSYYSLSEESMFLLYALGLGFLFSSLKTIPSVLLERELNFSKLVIPDVLENLVYNLTAVFFAWKGFGINSFSYAVLIRGIVGLVAIYIIKPWIPGLSFSRNAIKKLLSFGVPYQLNSFLATIKDDGMTVILGGILGTAGVGYLGWAHKWAQTPLRLFLDNVTKVTFPAFSRMQTNKKLLARTVTRSIFFVAFFVFPSTVGLLILAPILVNIVPSYDKWKPALVPLAFLSVNVVMAVFTSQLTNLFNAIGKIKITFKLMVMFTTLTWIFVPFFAIKYGVNGAAFGYALVGLSSLFAVYIGKKYVDFSLLESVVKPALASVSMAVVMLIAKNFMPHSMFGVIVTGGLGVIVYFVFSYILVGKSLTNDAKRSFSAMFSRDK